MEKYNVFTPGLFSLVENQKCIIITYTYEEKEDKSWGMITEDASSWVGSN